MLLVTGAAGFIGFHLTQALLERGYDVIGIDNLNDYYDVNLKLARLEQLKPYARLQFLKMDLADRDALNNLFQQYHFDQVIHLAAQAGVRYSLQNPYVYVDSNVDGFLNILENCRHHKIKHLVYASTSSVYGANGKQPFSESDSTEHPMSLYAATKKANEMMAHSYASLYGLPCTGLRFFTVYGPWGRPDMALFLFTKNILAGKPIDVYNDGNMIRDFTYVDDIVEGILRTLDHPAMPDPHWNAMHPNPATSYAPYRIYNIGNNKPIQLMDYIHAVEKVLGKKAILNKMPMQAGDVPSTCADTTRLKKELGYKPKVSVEKGVQKFVEWFLAYHSMLGN